MRTLVIAGLLWAWAGPASAQGLKLEFKDGKVSIDASNVPVRTLLTEWGRLGGTKVVGAERIAGSPLTIHLENVPEAQALEIVLRNVAGYMAAPRAAASLGASAYDRILVMPTSSAPPAAAANNRPNAAPPGLVGGRPGRGAFGAPQEPDLAAAVPEPAADEADTGVNEPVFQFPQQNPFLAAQPGQIPQPGAFGQPTPFGTPMAPGSQPPVMTFGPNGNQAVTVNPSPDQPTPVLQFPGFGNPGQPPPGGFGTMGSPMPGVIMQPAQPLQPGQIVRPPGID